MNSIIMPSYCPTPEVMQVQSKCLHYMLMHTVMPYELIIVENGSTHPCNGSEFCKYGAPIEQYSKIVFDKPIGYAKAVNIGISQAAGDYYFILNNDVFLPDRWDRDLFDAYRNLPKPGLLSPVDQKGLDRYYPDISWWSCVLIAKQVWNEIGKLDDQLLNYRFHDQDWSIRCRKAGYFVGRWGGVRVEHQDSTTYRHMMVQKEEAEERKEMVQRWGHAGFADWIRANGSIYTS